MKKHTRYSLRIFAVSLTLSSAMILAWPSGSVFGMTPDEFDRNVKTKETSFYREFFDKIFYEQIAQLFRLDQLKSKILTKKREALDINSFDEVPDSTFFINRHARNRFSQAELKRGPEKGAGPDPAGPWKVLKGEAVSVSISLLIEGPAGDRYLLKFDPRDNPEMTTSAELISQKLFYALGYNVPEYYLVKFNPSILTVDPKATYYNQDGFKKPLTSEALAEILEQVPKFSDSDMLFLGKLGEGRFILAYIKPNP